MRKKERWKRVSRFKRDSGQVQGTPAASFSRGSRTSDLRELSKLRDLSVFTIKSTSRQPRVETCFLKSTFQLEKIRNNENGKYVVIKGHTECNIAELQSGDEEKPKVGRKTNTLNRRSFDYCPSL